MKNFSTFAYVVIVFIGWGTSVFADKLAANSMGPKGTFLYVFSFVPSLLVLLFYLFWGYKMNGLSQIGVFWLVISTTVNILSLGAYYILFTKTDASWAAAITALYPIFTILLAVIFLHEKITVLRLLGIAFAMIAVLFLSI